MKCIINIWLVVHYYWALLLADHLTIWRPNFFTIRTLLCPINLKTKHGFSYLLSSRSASWAFGWPLRNQFLSLVFWVHITAINQIAGSWSSHPHTLTPLWGTILLSPPLPKSCGPLLGPAPSREGTTTLTALCQHIKKGKTLACSQTWHIRIWR